VLDVFVSELLGTGLLVLLGCGVVANVALAETKGAGGGFLMVNFGWGLAVFAGVFAAFKSGAHINPAVTFGLVAHGVEEYVPGVPVTVTSTLVYIAGQIVGAFLGAVLTWVAYRDHFGATQDAGAKFAVFPTSPAIRNTPSNFATEVIGTFVLVFVILTFGQNPAELGPLAVALLVVGIGASLGGPTGYAINPARDLGPRIAHALLPIPGKGTSDWSYAWVPIAAPIVGGMVGGFAAARYVA